MNLTKFLVDGWSSGACSEAVWPVLLPNLVQRLPGPCTVWAWELTDSQGSLPEAGKAWALAGTVMRLYLLGRKRTQMWRKGRLICFNQHSFFCNLYVFLVGFLFKGVLWIFFFKKIILIVSLKVSCLNFSVTIATTKISWSGPAIKPFLFQRFEAEVTLSGNKT